MGITGIGTVKRGSHKGCPYRSIDGATRARSPLSRCLSPGPLSRGRGDQNQASAFGRNPKSDHAETQRHNETQMVIFETPGGNHKGCPYEYGMDAGRRGFRALRVQHRFRNERRTVLSGVRLRSGGFFRADPSIALRHRGIGFVRRAQSFVFASGVIHGKTGPAPSGAVLFGPFSWAYKKKDEEEK